MALDSWGRWPTFSPFQAGYSLPRAALEVGEAERCIWCFLTNAVASLLQITEKTALFLERSAMWRRQRPDAGSWGPQQRFLASRFVGEDPGLHETMAASVSCCPTKCEVQEFSQRRGPANRDPGAKSSLILQIKFYLNAATPTCLRIVCGYFQMAELSGCGRGHLAPQSLEKSHSDPLRKRLPGPEWGRDRHQISEHPCLCDLM